ncbi:MAG: arginine repressor, partial [Clostridiales bacterium]|nr:arginine repressor [Clostridiales bacterium]
IDSMRWPEVLGTLSGDNTIMVVVRDEADAGLVVEKFHNILR